MEFKKYHHVEKFGNVEVDGINDGICYVFPKIDGTNASVWHDGVDIRAGSRNRELSLASDNAGFYEWLINQDSYREFFNEYPQLRLYGEWLVPHALKTYRDDAWRKFYIFDVENNGVLISYEEYKPVLDLFNLEYIPPIAKIKNPSMDVLITMLEKNDYLIKDGCGYGEGIVIKNYRYKNKFGRQTWAKIVTTDFKTKHKKASADVLEVKEKQSVESLIVDSYVNETLIDKIYYKIVTTNDGWSSCHIPQLLNTVFYDLVKEESWNFIKEYKDPVINYKELRRLTTAKTKEIKMELF